VDPSFLQSEVLASKKFVILAEFAIQKYISTINILVHIRRICEVMKIVEPICNIESYLNPLNPI